MTFSNVAADRVARFLVFAREQTITQGEELLTGLSSAREGWIATFGAKEVTRETEDGEQINCLHFEGSQKKAIIYLHGNGCFYETSVQRPLSWLPDLQNPHLLVFNPRGTAKSKGITHPETVAKDILAAFKYLVDEHSVDPNAIAIVGHSMGGFFSAFGAELVQKRFPSSTINFLGDRFFFDIHTRIDLKNANALSKKFMHQLVSYSKWDRDPIAALEGLKGRVCIIAHKEDPVVPYETSAHKAVVQMERMRNYTCLLLEETDAYDAHNREFNEQEYKIVIAELKKMLS